MVSAFGAFNRIGLHIDLLTFTLSIHLYHLRRRGEKQLAVSCKSGSLAWCNAYKDRVSFTSSIQVFLGLPPALYPEIRMLKTLLGSWCGAVGLCVRTI